MAPDDFPEQDNHDTPSVGHDRVDDSASSAERPAKFLRGFRNRWKLRAFARSEGDVNQSEFLDGRSQNMEDAWGEDNQTRD